MNNDTNQRLVTSRVKCRIKRIFFRYFLVLFLYPLSLIPYPLSAQIADSIQSSLQKKPGVIAGFATKSTFIDGFRSPIFTARAGLDFDHRIRMGAGISWLKLSPYDAGRDNMPFYLNKTLNVGTGDSIVHPALQFAYINLFLDYVYYKKNKWHFSIPIQFGIGGSSYKYDFNGKNSVENRHLVFLYEPAASGQYKITKWLGAGLEVGYRIMIISNKNIGSNFNSPVYDIKVMIFWGEFYKAIFKKPD